MYFIAGEKVRMSQLSKGVDTNNSMHIDVVVRGDVPQFSVASSMRVHLHPFSEDLIQTSAGSYVLSTIFIPFRPCSIPQAIMKRNHSFSTRLSTFVGKNYSYAVDANLPR